MSSPLFDPDRVWRQATGQNQSDILKECCENRAPALILSLENVQTCFHAQMAALSEGTVTLQLKHLLTIVPTIGSSCWVSFTYRGDSGALFSTILEYRPEQSPAPELVLKLGSSIVSAEARMAYRVKVAPDCPMTIRVYHDDGRAWDVKALDMSVTGMLIDFGATAPVFPIGTLIHITLILHSFIASLTAEVRRQVGSAYGVFFQDVVDGKRLLPPPALQCIVSALERHWLQERIRP